MKNILVKSKSRGKKADTAGDFCSISNFSVLQNHLEVLLKSRLLSSNLRVLDLVGLE